MRLGAILRGALKGGAAMQAGRVRGRNEATQVGREYERERQKYALAEAEYARRRDEDDRRAKAETIRLGLEQRRTRAAEVTAAATSRRAQNSGGTKDVQWKNTAEAARRYRDEGMPAHIASIKARMDNGASVGDAELEAYQRWDREQKSQIRGALTKGGVQMGGKKGGTGNIDLRK